MSLAPDRCVTCSDEAVEAEVLQLDGLTAIVAVDGERESVGIDLVPTAAPGDVLLCHAGIALARLGSPTGRPAEADHLPAR